MSRISCAVSSRSRQAPLPIRPRRPSTTSSPAAPSFSTAYQDAAYARRYLDRVAAVRAAETRAVPGSTLVTEAVARNLFKLMAIKDEYEVARLYTDGSFAKQTFQGISIV